MSLETDQPIRLRRCPLCHYQLKQLSVDELLEVIRLARLHAPSHGYELTDAEGARLRKMLEAETQPVFIQASYHMHIEFERNDGTQFKFVRNGKGT